jgi:hypothetical protein
MVVDAFLEAFNGDMSTRLIIKANGWAECRIREPFSPVDSHPQISLIRDTFSVPEINSLLHRCHAMIYPTSGEGFGLIPFQSIATGLPTASVSWGGVADFGEYIVPIDYTIAPTWHDFHFGEWAFPSLESVCEVMKDIRENYEKYRDWAYTNSLTIQRDWTWDALIAKALDASFL